MDCACVCCTEWVRVKCTRMPGDVHDMPRQLHAVPNNMQELEVLKERVTQLERLLTAIVKGVWYTLSRETAYNQLLNTTLGEGYRFETEH